jgi:hypothetical protein
MFHPETSRKTVQTGNPNTILLIFAKTNAILQVKQFITALLFLALLGQSFNRAMIVTSYYTNTQLTQKTARTRQDPSCAAMENAR